MLYFQETKNFSKEVFFLILKAVVWGWFYLIINFVFFSRKYISSTMPEVEFDKAPQENSWDKIQQFLSNTEVLDAEFFALEIGYVSRNMIYDNIFFQTDVGQFDKILS